MLPKLLYVYQNYTIDSRAWLEQGRVALAGVPQSAGLSYH
jgi:hypothetical protein